MLRARPSSYLSIVILTISLLIISCNCQTKQPQSAIITGDPAQAAFVTIFLSSTAFTDANINRVKNATALFPSMIDIGKKDVMDLTGAIGISASLWKLAYGNLPKKMVLPHSYFSDNGVQYIPSTGGDIFLHIKTEDHNTAYNIITAFLEILDDLVSNVKQTNGWRHGPSGLGRDLTNFIDGTENPSLMKERIAAALISDDAPHINGSFVMVQKWQHNLKLWEKESTRKQEQVIGRTKLKSEELTPVPKNSHVARTDQEVHGDIVRHSLPFGNRFGNDHGLLFVAYANDAGRFDSMLSSMVGTATGHDSLMQYSRCIESTFYYVPSNYELRNQS